MLRKDAEEKLEQLPRAERHIAELKRIKQLWERVLNGDSKALRRFLESRSNYEKVATLIGVDEVDVGAAYGHDILEDCGEQYASKILELAGEAVLNLVRELTFPTENGAWIKKSRAEKKCYQI